MMTMRDMENLVQRLQGRIEGIERKNAMLSANRAQRRKAAPAGGTMLQVNNGQTLYTGSVTILGISTSGTIITAVPTTTPGSGAYTAGLGAGYLINADGSLGALAWIANQPVNPGSGAVYPNLTVALPQGAPILALIAVTMPVTAGGTAPVYLPYFV